MEKENIEEIAYNFSSSHHEVFHVNGEELKRRSTVPKIHYEIGITIRLRNTDGRHFTASCHVKAFYGNTGRDYTVETNRVNLSRQAALSNVLCRAEDRILNEESGEDTVICSRIRSAVQNGIAAIRNSYMLILTEA